MEWVRAGPVGLTQGPEGHMGQKPPLENRGFSKKALSASQVKTAGNYLNIFP